MYWSGSVRRHLGLPERAGRCAHRAPPSWRIGRHHKETVAEDGEAAVHAAGLPCRAGKRACSSHNWRPLRASSRIGVPVAAGEVHDAVDHQRHGLERVAWLAGLEHPIHAQILDVGCVDLLQVAMPDGAVIAPVSQPVLRLVERVDQAVVSDVCAGSTDAASSATKASRLIVFPPPVFTPAPAFKSPRSESRYASRFCKSSWASGR